MAIRLFFTAFLSIYLTSCRAQTAPFGIELESVTVANLGGIQAYAFGQHQGKWLIVGGRLDGLHQRQPFAAFNQAGMNNQLLVVDPVSKTKWSAPMTSLPSDIREQLSSTNMEFYQEGEMLYCIGGYGYSPTEQDHTTFPFLTAISLPRTIQAVINNTDPSPYFRQIRDPKFQVTGGKLKKIYDTYYLLGGQKFLGRYNPMGPNHGPGFIQEYVDGIRVFKLEDNGSTLKVTHLPSYSDGANLHRRDYNAEAQILPDGSEGITMFSGVFQPNIDLPFLNSVEVDSSGYRVNNNFKQYYNHYHCAAIPLYSAQKNEMHTLFFGGIAQYYEKDGQLVQDNEVPFVKTIARVTRNGSGQMAEYKLPIEMPDLLGAGSEFIPNQNLPHYNNEVIKLDELTDQRVLLGYIYGGISSTAANIFRRNTGTQSHATSEIFAVYLTNYPTAQDQLNVQSTGEIHLAVFPNPNSGTFRVSFVLRQPGDVRLTIKTSSGQTVKDILLKDQPVGENTLTSEELSLKVAGNYTLTLESSGESITRVVLVE